MPEPAQTTEVLHRGAPRGDVHGLYPCLFVGTWLEAADVTALEAVLKPAQFVIEHQYGGLSCLSRTLWGILLPLSSCDDPMIAAELGRLAHTYYGQPFGDWDPSLDDLARLRDEMGQVGPLDCTRDFKDLHEAFLTFDFRLAWDWLRKHFRMATVIEDPVDGGLVEIAETERLPWARWEDFLDWMHSVDPSRMYTGGFHGIFLYENSD